MACSFFRVKPFIWVIVAVSALMLLLNVSLQSNALNETPPRNADPGIRKFAFMKNHKCASTTIENIIFRFAYKHQLNLVIPREGNYLSKTTLFHRATALKNAPWKNVEFDIFSLHNRWNYEEVTALLGKDVPTFTIVRDPVEVFESMFYYQPDFKKFYKVDNIHAFVEKVKKMGESEYMNRRWIGYIGRNQMAWDMGLSPRISSNMDLVDQEIARLDSEFDLVMISTRMDESLILLRDLLNWPMENIIYLSLNRRKKSLSSPLSDDERQILKDWLAADARIYDYFSHRFEERIQRANELNFSTYHNKTYVQTEVEKLQAANRELYKTCVKEEVGNEKLKGKFKETINTITGYIINEDVKGCELFAYSEPAYLEIFRKILQQAANS